MNYIDFRSDTVTRPTPAMRDAMMEALVGDDVYGEDPTMNKLEALAAEITGKEAALFVPSGTMGNQIAIMSHTQWGDEIILGTQCHINTTEASGPAQLSGVATNGIDNLNYHIYPEDIESRIRPRDTHTGPNTTLLCVENALGNGDVVSLEEMKANYDMAKKYNLAVHLDGARLFNATEYLGVTAKEMCAYTDSVMFCVSKGLAAPVGSLLCGTAEFIKKSRRKRKILGGGMRQAGVLAACGIVSLEHMIDRLKEDHDNAKYLGEKLSTIEGIQVDKDNIKINLVFWNSDSPKFNGEEFQKYMDDKGFKIGNPYGGPQRFATHNDIARGDIDRAVVATKEYMSTLI